MSWVGVESGHQIWALSWVGVESIKKYEVLSWVRVESPGLSHELESSQPEKKYESSTTALVRTSTWLRKLGTKLGVVAWLKAQLDYLGSVWLEARLGLAQDSIRLGSDRVSGLSSARLEYWVLRLDSKARSAWLRAQFSSALASDRLRLGSRNGTRLWLCSRLGSASWLANQLCVRLGTRVGLCFGLA